MSALLRDFSGALGRRACGSLVRSTFADRRAPSG